MTNKFDSESMKKLDSAWRHSTIPPRSTLEQIGLAAGDIVADIGCGIGYFTIPAAEMVNPRNKVYALDVSEDMLVEIEKRAQLAQLPNIVAVKTSEYDFRLPSESVTFALISNVLHEIEDKSLFLQKIKEILKSGGRVVVIDWVKEDMPMGPSIDQRLGSDEAAALLNNAGFVMHSEMRFSDILYGLIYFKE